MSQGIRLPTLYPMPRDREQYWVIYSASLDEPAESVYRQRLSQGLEKENSESYAPSMIDKLISSTAMTGFVRRDSREELILPPDPIRWRWNGKWDRSEEGFQEYVGETLLKWGKLFPDGLVLAYDLLTALASESLTQSGLLRALVGHDGESGKYDGRDRYAARTVREVVKLLEFAGWVVRDDRNVLITDLGDRRRSDLRERDPYHRVEKILSWSDPATTDIFTPRQKVKLARHYIYRECGGKYKKAEILDEVHDIIFKYPYQVTYPPKIKEERDRKKAERKKLKEEIAERDPQLGQMIEGFRSLAKLREISNALEDGRADRAWETVNRSGGSFSWESVRQLKHRGQDLTIDPDFDPYPWQSKALDEWKRADRRGVLQVVTGAGKTVLALMGMAELLNAEPETRTTILVPTKVLMYQWATELVRILGVPPKQIGLRGDGHKDSFASGKKVMVTIINSAIQDSYLARDVEELPGKVPHLLVADECHRYRGDEFRKAFRARYDFSLGLSATPVDPDQREPADEGDERPDPVIRALGDIFFEYTYREALKNGVVQDFTVKYVGVDLTSDERRLYDAYSKQIRKSLDRIRARYGPRLEAMRGPLFARLHTLLNSDENPDPAISRYFTAVRERKDLVFSARNRKWAYLDIIERHTAKRDDDREDKIIVFHERIENLEDVVAPTDQRKVLDNGEDLSVFRGLGGIGEDERGKIPAKYRSDPVEKLIDQNLEELFTKASFKPVMYHSGHSSSAWNDFAMEFFRADIANVMLSVKALVEGVDVPAANVGIIRASSSSVRQRIQTTGRILRRSRDKDRPAILYVIYVRDTTDERIFKGIDWSQQIGDSGIESYHWHAPEDGEQTRGGWEDLEGRLPEVPAFDEEEEHEDFDVEDLEPGDPYPGKYAGWEYHVDAEGNPFKKSRDGRRFITNDEVQVAARRIFGWKRGGKFVVTPDNHIVTKVKGRGLLFVGTMDGEIELEDPSQSGATSSLSGDPPTFEELFGS